MLLFDKGLPMAVSCLSVLDYSPRLLRNSIPYRPWPCFLAVVEGEYHYTSGGKEIVVRNGDVAFLPKNSVYQYTIVSRETRTMQLTFNIYPDELNASLPADITVLDSGTGSKIIRLFPKLLEVYRTDANIPCFSLSSLIFQCLGIMMKEMTFPPFSPQIMPAVRYLEQNYNESFPMSRLSELCNLSDSQLRKLFVKETGVSPLRYKNQLRAREACRLLEMKELNITEIAGALKFESPYAFSRFFKNETGVSPNTYKKQH